MVNFGYPYNDLVICKDSTDYLIHLGGHVILTYICFYMVSMTQHCTITGTMLVPVHYIVCTLKIVFFPRLQYSLLSK